MPARRIFCKGCKKYLGEIRDATLMKGIVHLCSICEIKRFASDLAQKTRMGVDSKDVGSMDFFNDIFRK